MTLSGGAGGSEHPRERGAGILTAQLRSHALVGNDSFKRPPVWRNRVCLTHPEK